MPQPGQETNPPTELMFNILPDRPARMDGRTERETFNIPSTFIAKIERTSGIEVSSIAPTKPRPALLTKTSIWPNSFNTASTAAAVCASSITSRGKTKRWSLSPSACLTTSGFLCDNFVSPGENRLRNLEAEPFRCASDKPYLLRHVFLHEFLLVFLRRTPDLISDRIATT